MVYYEPFEKSNRHNYHLTLSEINRSRFQPTETKITTFHNRAWGKSGDLFQVKPKSSSAFLRSNSQVPAPVLTSSHKTWGGGWRSPSPYRRYFRILRVPVEAGAEATTTSSAVCVCVGDGPASRA